jgi:hypothetical protein
MMMASMFRSSRMARSLLRKLATEFEGEHGPDVIRHCGWFGSSGDSQLCCRRRFEASREALLQRSRERKLGLLSTRAG